MRLYRATWAEHDPAQFDSFRSHYELQRSPRGPEIRAAVIHMAVSMFETAEPCWALIDRTKGRIGEKVAELRLVPGPRCLRRQDGRPSSLVRVGRSSGAASRDQRVRRQVDRADNLQ